MFRKGERGQALVMVAAALGIFLLGAVGLATDVGQLYAHRQMAQNAADAAAQAGILSIFNGTNTAANANAFGTTAFTCVAGDTRTPCLYANQNRFSNSAPDNVYVEFPASGSVPGVPNAVSLIRVTVRRTVPTTFMRLLGKNSGDIAASATAAILEVQSPVPIIIVHPTNPESFYKHGADNIVICGGPSKSIQVNSQSLNAVRDDGSGLVDLRLAGPGPTPTSPPCSGSGGVFGNHGGPSPYPNRGHLLPPDKYESPASIIPDPLLNVAPPDVLATMPNGTYQDYDPGDPGCPAECPPASLLGGGIRCRVYTPGRYTGGITVTQRFAVFKPGIYYLNGGGFHLQSNSIVRMATEAPYNSADTTTGTGWTENVLFYNSGNSPNDVIEIKSDSGKLPGNRIFPTPAGTYCESGGNCLIGAPNGAPYYGMLFFEDRNTAATLQHEISGGGGLTLKGTIYLTHTADGCPSCSSSIRADHFYQYLDLGGNAGGVTKVIGQIIVDALKMGGTPDITMVLNPEAMYTVRQVALVR